MSDDLLNLQHEPNDVGHDVPTHIGHYQIQSEIGRGTMGIVYKAFDPGIKRVVAIKVLRSEVFKDTDSAAAERFNVEAEAAGRLTHPGIVAIYEFSSENIPPYIVMEYAPGATLKDQIRKKIRFSSEAAISIVLQLLDALAYSHRHRVIHRDIKPGNIVVLEDGSIKITDFGIARLDTSGLTITGELIGTPNYMAPEQWNGEGVDARTDLFAVGVILYELLTGEQPFKGENMMTVRHRTLQVQPPLPSQLNPLSLPILDSIVQKAIAKDPAKRFQNAEEFSTALRHCDDATVMQPAALPSSTRKTGAKAYAPLRKVLIGTALVASIYLAAKQWTAHQYLQEHEPTRSAAASGVLTVTSDPVGAVVQRDSGEYLGVSPLEIQLPSGSYNLVFLKDGYERLEISVDIAPGEALPLDVTLHEGTDSHP